MGVADVDGVDVVGVVAGDDVGVAGDVVGVVCDVVGVVGDVVGVAGDVGADVVGDDDEGGDDEGNAGCGRGRAMVYEPSVPEHQTWSILQQPIPPIVLPRILRIRNPDNNRLPCRRLLWWMR